MRRLTKFEKEVAEYLNLFAIQLSADPIPLTFDNIYRNFAGFNFLNIVYSIHHPTDEFSFGEGSIVFHYKEVKGSSKQDLRKWEIYKFENSFLKRKFLDILNLIFLLQENNLISIEKGFTDITSGYLPLGIDAARLSASSTLVKMYGEENYYIPVGSKRIDDKEFQVLLNSTFQLTAAYEIFVANGYKTEEQVKNDEEREINTSLLKQNEETVKIAKDSAMAAKNAVYVSALAVLLTLGYTIYHDYQKDSDDAKREIKEDLFKNEGMIQMDEAVNKIDSIRTDIKKSLKKPEVKK
jgi:hypothetical protein